MSTDFGFLSGLRTGIDVTSLNGAATDRSFDWDADLSFDLDVFDLGFMRGNLFLGYEQIVGRQKRNIDPNQNSYAIDGSIFFPLRHGELGAVFHHVSRHRVDRSTDQAMSWNLVGGSYGHRVVVSQFALHAGVRGMFNVERADVDYRGQIETFFSAMRALNSRYAVVGRAEGVIVPVEPQMFDRTTQRGGRLEGALRVFGDIADFDAFVAWEQRIDASFAKRDTVRWVLAGLRVTAAVP